MAKLTKAQRHLISNAIHDLQRGIKFIESDRIAVARRERHATTCLEFTRKPVSPELLPRDARELGDYCLYEICKDIGSDLTGFRMALRSLESLYCEESGQ